MEKRPKGGRWKKESYSSKTLRLPEPAISAALEIGDKVRDIYRDGEPEFKPVFCPLELTEAEAIAREISSGKGTKKQMAEMLVKKLYGVS